MPETPEKHEATPGSGITRASVEKSPAAQAAPEGVPADVTNLAIAAGLLLSAFLIFWMGSYLANHVALRTLVASFGTFALVWVLFRLRVFQRPHGGLIVAGAVALFAAALPFAERGFQKLDHAAKTGLGGEPVKRDVEPADQLPVPNRQTAPPAPASPSAPTAPAPEKSTPPEPGPVGELLAPEPDPSAGKVIIVTRESQITINGRKYRIHEGSKFPYTKFEDGIVTFQANGQDATISASVVKFTGASKETPREITQLAQVEAMRRYPALADPDSAENQLYVALAKELKEANPDLTKDPHWPLVIAEQIAAQEGWKRADLPPDDTAPTTPLTEEEMKAAKPASPPPTDPADFVVPQNPPIPAPPSEIPPVAPPVAK